METVTTDFKNILVATDVRLQDHTIVEEAALIAKDNQATIKIVDVVPEFPWIVRVSLNDHQSIRSLVLEDKRKHLEAVAEPLRQRGLRVETEVLSGKTSVEIIREVLRNKHDLVLRVAKGPDSRREGYFGTTGIHLLRNCPCAVWLATSAASPEYKHVMACVDTSSEEPLDDELNHKVYRAANFVSRQHEAALSIVHAWTIFGEEFLFTRTRLEDFEQLQHDVRERSESMLDQFLRQHGSHARARNVHLLKGNATSVLPAYGRAENVDLLVMGTVARSGATGLVMGNTAERILANIRCSVLALKPEEFVCPITLGT